MTKVGNELLCKLNRLLLLYLADWFFRVRPAPSVTYLKTNVKSKKTIRFRCQTNHS